MNLKIDRKKVKFYTKPFINGRFINPSSSDQVKKVSPANNKKLASICDSNSKDVELAVESAKNAYESKVWVNLDLSQKKIILYKLADLIKEYKAEISFIDTLETGRSIKNFYFDSIPKAIDALIWFIEASDKFYGQATHMAKNNNSILIYEPIGVVGAIIPWNDPLVVAVWKFAPALLVGNSIIIKPAEQSTYSMLFVANLAKKAGIPDGVFNVITGYGETAGKALAMHRDVDAIFFTGSSSTGKKIIGYSGKSNMKKVSLECGGKSPFIISQNSKNMHYAAASLAKNIFYNQGQICSAPSRLLINSKIKKDFIKILKSNIQKYVPADPFSLSTEVGCLISEKSKLKIEDIIEKALAQGAKKVNYKYSSDNLPESGNYILPTILDNVNPNSKFSKIEIFGPVLSIIEYQNDEEAIRYANNTNYGLAASIWSSDIDEVYKFTRSIRCGIIHINSYGEDDNMIPFGGIKESGIGKDKSFKSLKEYSILKSICYRYDE